MSSIAKGVEICLCTLLDERIGRNEANEIRPLDERSSLPASSPAQHGF
jgi:hypothetical protein